MEQKEIYLIDDFQSLDLKSFFKKLLRQWYWFALSVPLCLIIAFVYGKATEPVYEVNTMLLIDEGADERTLGESPFIQGGVKLIGSQKNLKNEIGILGSYNLVRDAIETLDFGVSYHATKWFGFHRREYYQHFPFTVVPSDSSSQIGSQAFEVELLSADRYKLSIEVDEFKVFDPLANTRRMVESDLDFEGEYAFGEEVVHPYFRFTLHKSEDAMQTGEFDGKGLEFVLHDLDGLAAGYKNKLEIKTIDLEASILEMKTSGKVVQKEIDFLNALNRTYISNKINDKKEAASSTLSFIENQVSSIRDSLEMAEKKLERFRRNNRAVDLNFTAQNALGQLENLEADKAALQLKDQYYASLLEDLDESTPIERIVAPSGVGVSDPVVNQLVLDLKDLNQQKLKLAYTAGEGSYDLKIIDNQIASAKSSLQQNLQSLSEVTQRTLQNNRSRIGRIESTISRLPGNEKALVEIQRKYTLNENLYNYLRQRLAEIGIAKAEQMADSKVLDEPRMVGDKPVAPQKKLLLLAALLIGLLIPTGIVVLQDPKTELIDGVEQLEKLSDTPLIASIAHHRGAAANSLVRKESAWQVAESFRDLSAQVQHLVPPVNPTVLGFTSTVSGEGKTFCAANLAKALADAGIKVLLIDLDLRNPSLLNYFAVEEIKGFSDYLKGEVEFLSEIIYPLENELLHCIPTMPVEGNVHRWINDPRMENMILQLKEEYQYIILDMPPVGLVSDFLLFSKYLDLSFYVMRNQYSKVEYLKSMRKLKQKNGLEDLYMVLNDVRSKRFKYGYYDYRYYKNN